MDFDYVVRGVYTDLFQRFRENSLKLHSRLTAIANITQRQHKEVSAEIDLSRPLRTITVKLKADEASKIFMCIPDPEDSQYLWDIFAAMQRAMKEDTSFECWRLKIPTITIYSEDAENEG